MKYRPCGYRVLIKMDSVDKEITEGALKGFKLGSDDEQKKEEHGHCIGRIVSFGPTAFKGYAGCESPEDWGAKVGDLVEFNRYDGKIPLGDTNEEYRIINDCDILMVVSDE